MQSPTVRVKQKGMRKKKKLEIWSCKERAGRQHEHKIESLLSFSTWSHSFLHVPEHMHTGVASPEVKHLLPKF